VDGKILLPLSIIWKAKVEGEGKKDGWKKEMGLGSLPMRNVVKEDFAVTHEKGKRKGKKREGRKRER